MFRSRRLAIFAITSQIALLLAYPIDLLAADKVADKTSGEATDTATGKAANGTAAPVASEKPKGPEKTKPTLAEQANLLLEDIARLEAEGRMANDQAKAAEDSERRAVFELQRRHHIFDWMKAVEELVQNVLAQQEAGLNAKVFLQKVRKLLLALDRRIPQFIDGVSAENIRLRDRLTQAQESEVAGIESLIAGSEELLDEGVRFYLSYIESLDDLGMSSKKARAKASAKLDRRASNLAARLELASQRLDDLQSESSSPGESVGPQELRAAQDVVDRTAASLWTTLDAMDELELSTAQFRKVLILATGEISTDVFDAEVATDILDEMTQEAERWLARRGPVLMGRGMIFFSVLLAFWVIASIVRRITSRVVGHSNSQVSGLARGIIVRSTYQAILAIGFLVALSQIGVNVTALLTGLGIAGFIIGFALQETLGNFAAGAMIVFYRPFDVGDTIEAAGVVGVVDKMNLVSTTVLTFDNQNLIIPNSRIWGNVIRNATSSSQRRVDLSFPLALDSNVEAAERLFTEICQAHPAVLADPEPAIKVHEIDSQGIHFIVRPWVQTEDYWPTFWELNREIQVRLADAGLRIAPTRYEVFSPPSGSPET